MRAIRLGRAASLALLVLALTPPPSAAQTKPKPADTRVKVGRFELEGVRAFSQSQIKRELATKAGSWIPWSRPHYFDPDTFEADKRRIAAFYATRGYPKARVEAADTRFDDDRTRVDLVIRIAEGEPIVVRGIDLSGFDVAPAEHLEELRKRLPIKVEQPLDRRLVLESRTILATELRDHGFPQADVSIEATSAGESAAHLTFLAQPGTKAVFGPIQIVGNSSVGDQVIRRQLMYEPGQLFRISQVRDSQRKLYTQKLFQFVNIDVEPPNETLGAHGAPARERSGAEGPPRATEPGSGAEPRSGEVPTRVTVAEGKHRRIEFRAGWGSEEKARGEARWEHVNFLGGARTGSIQGKWSSLDRGVRVRLNQPYLFRPHFALDLEGHTWHAQEPAYRVESYGSQVSVAHRANATTSWSLAALHRFESSEIAPAALTDPTLHDELIALGLDPITGTERGRLTAWQFEANRNTTQQPLDPIAGHLLSVHLEQAGRWMPGDFEYYRLVLEGRHYVNLLAERLVFANRLRLGAIDPLSDRAGAVPFFKRFFIGGSSSVRGWGRFELGPLTDSGLPIGGHSVLEALSEVRLRLTERLGAVVFLDAGNVWRDAWHLKAGDLKYAVGPGLRYYTPIGPVRVDLGYQLTPTPLLLVDGRPQVRNWRLHFSIGQAF